jgi:uncharacterized lipoprotein YmbA
MKINRSEVSLSWLYLGFVSVFLIALTGCVNLKPKQVETKLYALGAVDSRSAFKVDGPPLYVARPHLPAYLDGKRLQYRSANGEVKELSRARWAEPLEEGVARSLAEFLTRGGYAGATGFYPWPKRSKGGLELRVYFHKLGALEDGTIRMAAGWDLRQGSKVQKTGAFDSAEINWNASDADSLVAGINSALDQLAKEIANSL